MMAEDVLRSLRSAGKGHRAVWTIEGRHRRMQIDDMPAVLQAAGESRPVMAEAALQRERPTPGRCDGNGGHFR